ncbi:hypothetical protein [Geoalkalibacter subterraneus]|nr:hypothetical protein [Geoalkalibacter subterraneus]
MRRSEQAAKTLQLKSDFRDWYDCAFDLQGQMVFERLSTAGMSRRQMFAFLQKLGLRTPRHGLVEDLVSALTHDCEDWPKDLQRRFLDQAVDVVIYHDEQAHCGEGKQKISAGKALDLYPDTYASEFIPSVAGRGSVSLRYLQVGQRRWWLRYWSQDDWRSNAGEGDCEILCEEKPGRPHEINDPLFAVDFIRAGKKLYAIDFNIAPGLAPLNGLLLPSEVVSQISSFIQPLQQ